VRTAQRCVAPAELPQGGRARDAGGRGTLRSDLEVKGIKAQVLARIEALEEREREKEELLAELVPAAGAREHDMGP
jgi:hypothetical protein